MKETTDKTIEMAALAGVHVLFMLCGIWTGDECLAGVGAGFATAAVWWVAVSLGVRAWLQQWEAGK